MLGADDPLPARPRRVLIAGASGAGKTTLAARVAEVIGAPHIEIDALHHGPAWTPRPTFEAEVRAFADGPAWVTEWQYSRVRPLLAERADLLVWLDLPRATVVRQVIRRTVGRAARRQVLWNGNREPPLWTFFTDRDHIIRWAWRTHVHSATRIQSLREQRPELTIVRFTSHAREQRWLAGPLQTSLRDASKRHPR